MQYLMTSKGSNKMTKLSMTRNSRQMSASFYSSRGSMECVAKWTSIIN
jgi:hypothetical protein